MTPDEYKRARADYEGKRALTGCLLMAVIFFLTPLAIALFGIPEGLIAGAFMVAGTGWLGAKMQQ